jgi:SAM-dependent methyltransferase
MESAALAKTYDAVPYRPAPNAFVGVRQLRARAALYGCENEGRDALDLGCGAGAQLLLAAEETQGRLVGVELSADACNEARRALADHAPRAEILNADLLSITPDALGRFDVIYCLGVISFVPPAVREQLVALIGACLNPGGVAVLSYYTGGKFALRASIARTLQAVVDRTADPDAQISQARAALAQLRAGLPETTDGLAAAAADHIAGLQDVMLFHEVLNPEAVALETAPLERELSAHGVGFIGPPDMGFATSRGRAFDADLRALTAGRYAFSIFARGEGAFGRADPRSPQLEWSTRLRRQAGTSESYLAPASYEWPDGGPAFSIEHAVTQALLDVVAERPLTWSEALATAQARVSAAAPSAPTIPETLVADGLITVWANNGALPRLRAP